MHFLLVVVAAYFLPTIIAFSRNHHNACAICALNSILGWTVIGWIAALVWSLTAVRPISRAA
ncbi:MAG TPA: superinfection immunity protein [Steroidobacteraceae bacterium]|nr:superinfection immunity protein [Steroidobacteraceae bacterium]